MRLEDDDIRSHYRGMNPTFVRHVWAQRKGWIAPAPKVEKPQFKPHSHRTWALRKQRENFKKRAANIDAETRSFQDNPPDDAEKMAGAIFHEVVIKHGVTKQDVRSGSRAVFIRAVKWQVCCRIYLSRPEMSLLSIGRLMHMDHTSVLHAVSKMGIRRASRPHQKRKP